MVGGKIALLAALEAMLLRYVVLERFLTAGLALNSLEEAGTDALAERDLNAFVAVPPADFRGATMANGLAEGQSLASVVQSKAAKVQSVTRRIRSAAINQSLPFGGQWLVHVMGSKTR